MSHLSASRSALAPSDEELNGMEIAGPDLRPLAAAIKNGQRRGPPKAIRLVLPVWGASFVSQFLKFGLRTLLAPGNLPAVAALLPCEFVIMTRAEDEPLFQLHPSFRALMDVCLVRILVARMALDAVLIPDWLDLSCVTEASWGIHRLGSVRAKVLHRTFLGIGQKTFHFLYRFVTLGEKWFDLLWFSLQCRRHRSVVDVGVALVLVAADARQLLARQDHRPASHVLHHAASFIQHLEKDGHA